MSKVAKRGAHVREEYSVLSQSHFYREKLRKNLEFFMVRKSEQQNSLELKKRQTRCRNVRDEERARFIEDHELLADFEDAKVNDVSTRMTGDTQLGSVSLERTQ